MKKSVLGLMAFCLLFFTACNSGDKKTTETAAGDTAAKATQLPDMIPVQEIPVEDPDPKDTIPADGYVMNSYSKQAADLVRLTLKDKYKDDLAKNFIDDFGRRFILFENDLNGDGKKEILVGLIGTYFCGSGGCTILLLNDQGDQITKFSVSDYPVVIDNQKTNGWNNLFINSNGKYHTMKFDGKSYPSNPSTQPALKTIPGDDLIRALNYLKQPYPWYTF
jgi:hypothetical protein